LETDRSFTLSKQLRKLVLMTAEKEKKRVVFAPAAWHSGGKAGWAAREYS
jgi:hypothetical protein